MVEKYRVPFLGIPYEVWKFGPVQKDLYIDLTDNPYLMKDYISQYMSEDKKYFRAKSSFCDDEFSQAEISVMDEVLEKYGRMSATQLIKLLHSPGSLWYRSASQHHILDSFRDGSCNSTDIKIDFSELFESQSAKEEYAENLAIRRTANNLNARANV